jgi:superfamily I DNA/RNA helicase
MEEVKRWMDDEKEDKAEETGDLYDTLIGLAEEVESIEKLKDSINELFRDKSSYNAVACSTVHKAKGLEWNRVFLLIDTFNMKNEENRNILYVAITRAKQELVYVTSVKDEVKTEQKKTEQKKTETTPVLPRLGGPRTSNDGATVPYFDLDD